MMKSDDFKCSKCGGRLLDEEVFLDRLRIKRIISLFSIMLPILIIMSPLFCIFRLFILGGHKIIMTNIHEIIISIIPQKILIGVIISIVLSTSTGLFGRDWGVFIATITGAVAGGFFMAATKFLPLRSEAEYRWDIVIISLSGGILLFLIVAFSEFYIKKIFGNFLGPEIKE